ncbi:MAG: ThiF family adenylyltransferase [Desulfobacter sp.]
MDIAYQLIKTTTEKIRLYQFRKQVFVDEENRFDNDSDHISDIYDTIDETVNLAALSNEKIIAALRVTLESRAGLPVDQHWDFKTYRSRLSRSCSSFGWLCCAKAFRHQKGMIKTLVAKGAEQAKERGASHILAVIHPPVFDLLHHCFGAKQIGPAFKDPHLDVDMIPIHARVDEILDRFPAAIAGTDDCRPDPGSGNNECRAVVAPSAPAPGTGPQGKHHFFEQAMSRNLGILTPADQERLLNARIAIPGLGGVGGQHLITLARIGIGNFTIADFDTFETKNINRQYGARVSNLDRPKIEVMAEDALEVNPFLDIRQFPQGVTPENIDDFLSGADLVADGMDFFNIEIRRLVFNRAREKNIPVITAGPLGFSAALLIFMPGRGMGFDRYFNISDDLDREEKLVRFFVGLAPKATQAAYIDPAAISMSGEQGPSTGAGCLMCSGVLASEAVRILLDKKGIKPAPNYFQYDPFARRFHQGYLPLGNRHPVQRVKTWMITRRLRTALPLGIPASPAPDGDPSAPLPRAVINYLINAGCQAPSGDNCQPWKFTSESSRLALCLDPDADHSFFNVNQTASLIACGAAIENVCLAATRYGISARVTCLPDPGRQDLLAHIDLAREETPESPLSRFIWSRHTNRTRYNGRPLPDADIDALNSSIEGFPDARLVLVRDRQQIKQVADLVYAADTIRSQRRDLHTHLMKMIRFTPEQALLKRDGFPLKNLEAGISGEMMLRLCRPWPVMRMANRAGMGQMVAKTAARWVRQSSAMGLLTIRGRDTNAWLSGGRALERIWLTAARSGISFQPMTAITLFRERWRSGRKDRFSMTHQQRLGQLWPLYDHIFKTDPAESQIMLFRLGYGAHVSCRTLRYYQGTPV